MKLAWTLVGLKQLGKIISVIILQFEKPFIRLFGYDPLFDIFILPMVIVIYNSIFGFVIVAFNDDDFLISQGIGVFILVALLLFLPTLVVNVLSKLFFGERLSAVITQISMPLILILTNDGNQMGPLFIILASSLIFTVLFMLIKRRKYFAQ